MHKIAQFEKVSFEQFKKDFIKDNLAWYLIASKEIPFMDNPNADERIEKYIREIYDGIKLPKRATVGSAGYDFFTPVRILLPSGKTVKLPTGIRVRIDDGWVLKLYPRSGLGFKYRMQLDNTVGIIDSDYYYSDNEGHIMMKFTNDGNSRDPINVPSGQGCMQGIFVPYGITVDDDADGIRNGGFGSTTK